MIYKKPKTLFLELEEEDVVTLSIGDDLDPGGKDPEIPDDWWD